MKKKLFWSIAVLVIALYSFLAGRTQGNPAPPQELAARCVFSVPKEWGEYVGSGSYGLAFRDSNGSLRFINTFPCGLEGAPQVSLAIRRK